MGYGDGDVDSGATVFILVSGIVGMLFAYFQFRKVAAVKLEGQDDNQLGLLVDGDASGRLLEIYNAIREGADSFLFAEYRICGYFIIVFGGLVLVLTSLVRVDGKNEWHWDEGALTALAFVVGSVTSIISGYLGMKVAVFSNARTTVSAMDPANPWTHSFNTAFRAGGVMGFSLCGLGLVVLYLLAVAYNGVFHFDDAEKGKKLFEAVAGFGLGGSSIALFGRVGGGIYTKAADVGADLAGKVVSGIPEDDPRNPATIADNVGDNVGDVAGMGSDLFGSFAEASCAALIVAATSLKSDGKIMDWTGIMFPLFISAIGIWVCMITSFVATNISPVRKEEDVEKVLKVQIAVSTILMAAAIIPAGYAVLPSKYSVETVRNHDDLEGTPFKAIACVWSGLFAGALIGFVTEYYTSHSYQPTREVAYSCETGAATNIIYGLALGYKSTIIPVFLIATVVYISFTLLDMYGVALGALGMLATLATCLSIDVYGPVCDNAGGIAEMSGLPEEVREKTDALDAAGNTTAAIGKGFAIGSACLVGLALFGAFIKRTNLSPDDVSLLSPVVFAMLLLGAMIPYWFSAMTMKSVGIAAKAMVKEVKYQFDTIPGLLTGEPGHAPPDYAKCIKISTDASLREMIPPAILVMGSPIVAGVLFGANGLAGMLAGCIASAVQMAIASSNTGGAWDNAKKFIEKGIHIDGVAHGKGSEVHKAAVVGDTVGDPLKDTSGPALNITMKLTCILSLVLADFFKTINDGKGLIDF